MLAEGYFNQNGGLNCTLNLTLNGLDRKQKIASYRYTGIKQMERTCCVSWILHLDMTLSRIPSQKLGAIAPIKQSKQMIKLHSLVAFSIL